MGGHDVRGSRRAPSDRGPVVHEKAYALMGGVDVWRTPVTARGRRLRDVRKAAKELERWASLAGSGNHNAVIVRKIVSTRTVAGAQSR